MLNFTNLSHLDRPIIIAHRGASAAERENTLEAFEAAIRMGADAIEIDVRRTRDGIIVVHHDPNITGSGTAIASLTYAKAEEQAQRAGFHLPTLDETLQMCRGRVPLDIELKEQGYEGDIVPFLRERADSANIAITSFNDDTIKRVKAVWPEVKAGLILGLEPPVPIARRLSEFFPIKRLRCCEADFVVPHFRLVKFGFLRRMRSAGYPVWVWTVDDTALAQRLLALRIAAIVSNRPDILLELRR